MATTDTQLEQIIFNTMSQEKYDELKANGQINPNELYLVPDTEEIPENVVQSDNYENAKLWKGTLAEYEALGTYDDSITYIITDDNEELDVYTKEEVDEKLENVTVDLSDYATKTYVASAVSPKANTTYVDEQLALKADKTEIPTNVSAFTNDAGYLTEHQDISGKADKSTTLSGYGITDAYTKTEVDGLLNNISDDLTEYAKTTYVNEKLALKADKETTYTKTEVDGLVSPKADKTYVDEQLNLKADKTEIPTKTSQLTNDSGYLTEIPSEYITEDELNAKGYLTEHQDISSKADTTYVNEQLALKADKTSIGNGTLTIQKNGVNVAKFSANQSGNITANIEADVQVNADWNATSGVAQILNKPTNVSAFTNDAGYLTSHQDISGKADISDTLAGYGITDAYTKSEVDAKVSSVYRFKGSVANYDSLPTTGLVIGDVYNIEDTGDNYAWTGSVWDKLAGDIDLTPYLTKEEATTTYETIANVSSHTSNTSNPHKVTKAQVGLGNVDNTSDLNKPISTATQTALDSKVSDVKVGNTSVVSNMVASLGTMATESASDYSTKIVADTLYADISYENTTDTHIANTSNPHKVTKAQVGLGNVDNTSDLNKPISTATQTALNLKANDSEVVHKSGNETIAGVKTFSSSPIVPTISDVTDSTQNVASTKFVQDVVNTNKTTITYWD